MAIPHGGLCWMATYDKSHYVTQRRSYPAYNLADTEDLRDACRASAARGLVAWARSYRPTGNPINENLLIPWIQAWDVMKPLLSPSDERVLQAFGRRLASASRTTSTGA